MEQRPIAQTAVAAASRTKGERDLRSACAHDGVFVYVRNLPITGVERAHGHFGDYADHLAGLYRKSVDFQKSKGWIKASYILAHVNKRADEPDLYLVTIADRPTTAAEDEMRAKEINAFLQSSARQGDAQSGERAKYRHLGGNMLLQEIV